MINIKIIIKINVNNLVSNLRFLKKILIIASNGTNNFMKILQLEAKPVLFFTLKVKL